MRIVKTNVLTPISATKISLLNNVYVKIKNNIIYDITKQLDDGEEWEDFLGCICIPGFVDVHVHLSQFHARGKHSSNLLDWLNNYIFSTELISRDAKKASEIAYDFFKVAFSKGTTTAVIYTAPFKHACEVAFKVARDLGARAIIGKTMMDMNSPEYLIEKRENSIRESIELYEKWNNKNDLLEYIFTPRFAPVCSSELMWEIGNFAKQNNAYIQTHLSENKGEIELVKEMFPEYKSYTEVYEKHNLLGPNTILGHVIHASDNELEVIKNTNSKIAHCPDSNFFLKSGIFPLKNIKEKGIEFALASDVGAGTTLSMLYVMKMFNYMQMNYIVSPEEAFYYATLGGAQILGKKAKIGSVEKGKEADLVFITKPDIHHKSKQEILSDLLYLGNEQVIKETIIAGKTVYKK